MSIQYVPAAPTAGAAVAYVGVATLFHFCTLLSVTTSKIAKSFTSGSCHNVPFAAAPVGSVVATAITNPPVATEASVEISSHSVLVRSYRLIAKPLVPISNHMSPSTNARATPAVPSAGKSFAVPSGALASTYVVAAAANAPPVVVYNLVAKSIPIPGVVVLIHKSPAAASEPVGSE